MLKKINKMDTETWRLLEDSQGSPGTIGFSRGSWRAIGRFHGGLKQQERNEDLPTFGLVGFSW